MKTYKELQESIKLHTVKVVLDESTFISNSPSTGASVGVKFEVKKNAEKSVGEHPNGQPKEHYDIYHGDKHIGHISTHSDYKDKKSAGSRIVSSRKDVRSWGVTLNGGEHNATSIWNRTDPSHPYYKMGLSSKKEALQHLADYHKTNPNR